MASLFPSRRSRSWRARMNAVVDGSRQRRRIICGRGMTMKKEKKKRPLRR
jgi:hypothetical protein